MRGGAEAAEGSRSGLGLVGQCAKNEPLQRRTEMRGGAKAAEGSRSGPGLVGQCAKNEPLA